MHALRAAVRSDAPLKPDVAVALMEAYVRLVPTSVLAAAEESAGGEGGAPAASEQRDEL